MIPLLSAEASKKADQYTIEKLGIPELVLMEHAAEALVAALERRFGKLLPTTRGVVFAGTGNNGGDALAAARILKNRGCPNLEVFVIGDIAALTPSAAHQRKILEGLGHRLATGSWEEAITGCDWVLDGLFGTGLKRLVDGEAKKIISKMNVTRAWVVSADLPSGLSADTGQAMGIAMLANETVTLGFVKKGLVTGDAADYTGTITLATIEIPRQIPGLTATEFWFTREDAAEALPPRRPSGHKGEYGHVYVWAGEPGKQGAATVCSRGALRAGAGLVTLIGKSGELEGIRPRLLPEVMTLAWEEKLMERDLKNTVGVIGPGLGTDAEAWKVLETVLKGSIPLVLDADALNLLAANPERAVGLLKRRSVPTVLTPHPKEAGRLLGKEATEVQADRYRACADLVARFDSCIVLKGKGTVVGTPGNPRIVITAGDSGLSKGGTGDLLAGLIGAFLAQAVPVEKALPLAVYVHGRASEIVTESHGQERSTIATDIADRLPAVFRELEWPS